MLNKTHAHNYDCQCRLQSSQNGRPEFQSSVLVSALRTQRDKTSQCLVSPPLRQHRRTNCAHHAQKSYRTCILSIIIHRPPFPFHAETAVENVSLVPAGSSGTGAGRTARQGVSIAILSSSYSYSSSSTGKAAKTAAAAPDWPLSQTPALPLP